MDYELLLTAPGAGHQRRDRAGPDGELVRVGQADGP